MASKNIEFTARLKQAIIDTGLDKKHFAQKAKMGYTTLMNYLIPKGFGRVPEWDQLVKISKASGKSIDWLLMGYPPIVQNALEIKESTIEYNTHPSEVINLQADLIKTLKENTLLREKIKSLEEARQWTGEERRVANLPPGGAAK